MPYTGADAYNYGALNYYMRPDERWNAGAFAHYNVDENHQVYGSFMFMDDDSVAQIAPSGAFIGTGTGSNPYTGEPDGEWTINCNNPLPSDQEAAAFGCASHSPALSNTQTVQTLFGRRDVEGGSRQTETRHTSYRFVIGSKGQITDDLAYDVYAQEGVTLRDDFSSNDLLKSAVSNALLAVQDPLTGNIVCSANANGANGAPGCVPWNIWGTGPVSQAAVAYMETPGLLQRKAEERVYHADFTSDLTDAGVKLPTANEGLALNFGAEYRQEFMSVQPDLVTIQGSLTGTGAAAPPMNAGYGVKEAFVEARIPLVQDKPLAKEISLDTAYRYSKYDVGSTTSTYKLGLDYSPTSSFDVEPYPGSGDYNCAGYFGATCLNPRPKWKHTFTAGWATPWRGLGLQARWRHVGDAEVDLANPSPLLAGKFGPAIQYTGTRDYFDLVATDQILSGVQLQVGINNILDKDPPILTTNAFPPPFFNGNTYPQVWDTLGRYLFANLKIDF